MTALILTAILAALSLCASVTSMLLRRRPEIRRFWPELSAWVAVLLFLGAFAALCVALERYGVAWGATLGWSYFALSLLSLIFQVVERRRAGGVLLDCGWRAKYSWLWAAFIVILVVAGLDSTGGDRGTLLGFALWGLAYIMRRPQIREAGVMADTGLQRWKKITGYTVTQDGTVRLMNTFIRSTKLSVSAERRAECLRLLAERLGTPVAQSAS